MVLRKTVVLYNHTNKSYNYLGLQYYNYLVINYIVNILVGGILCTIQVPNVGFHNTMNV